MPIGDGKGLLRVQTVLYETGPDQVWRLAQGLDAAARLALAAGAIGAVHWALGDCSPTPVLNEEAATDMLQRSGALAEVSYEFFGENLGSSGGQNRLAGAGSDELLFVLNPDTYPAPTALLELIRALGSGHVGIAEARQIPLEHPKAFDPRSGDTSWASGCCMMVRSEVFRELGGFDHANFLLQGDDVDFSWRVRAAGWRVLTVPQAVIFHDKRPASGEAYPTPDVERYHAVFGRLMLARKWGRPDIVESTLAHVEADGSQIQRRAVADYRTRAEEGRVPEPLADGAVAEFINGEYAVHRF